MRDDVRAILALARRAAQGDPHAACPQPPVPCEASWRRLGVLADAHGLTGFLHDAARRLPPDAVPAAAADRLETRWRRQKLRTLAQLRAYRTVLAELTAASVPCIVLKGFDLAQRLYPDPGLRPFQDLDLLLRRSDLDSAVAVLSRGGYRRPPAQLPGFLIRRFHFHLPLVHPGNGTLVELHWSPADGAAIGRAFRFDEVYVQSPRTALGYRVLPPALYAAYLLAHADRHGALNPWIVPHPRGDELVCHPHGGNRLIWFVDLARMLRLSPVSGIAEAAAGWGMGAAAARSLYLVHRLLGDTCRPCPPPVRGGGGERLAQARIAALVRDLDGNADWGRPPPLWRTNQHIHLRPIRLLLRERACVPSP